MGLGTERVDTLRLTCHYMHPATAYAGTPALILPPTAPLQPTPTPRGQDLLEPTPPPPSPVPGSTAPLPAAATAGNPARE